MTRYCGIVLKDGDMLYRVGDGHVCIRYPLGCPYWSHGVRARTRCITLTPEHNRCPNSIHMGEKVILVRLSYLLNTPCVESMCEEVTE